MLLLAALRHLNLVSDKGIPAPELESLLQAEGKKRREIWLRILMNAYPAFFNHEIDLTRITTDEMAEIFAKEGVTSPDTIRKCVTFLFRAAKDAGLKSSPYVKPYAGTRTSPRHAKSSADKTEPPTKEPEALPDRRDGQSPSVLKLLLSKVPDWSPDWPQEKTNRWLRTIAEIKIIADKGETNGLIPGNKE
jgi:hypothetical protein